MNLPPKLHAEGISSSHRILLGGSIFGGIGAFLLARALIEEPASVLKVPCGFRWLTGFPCPFCGGTHALAALTHGQWGDSLRQNPLTGFIVFVVLIGWILRILEFKKIISSERMNRLRPRWEFWATVVILNWSYLCLARLYG